MKLPVNTPLSREVIAETMLVAAASRSKLFKPCTDTLGATRQLQVHIDRARNHQLPTPVNRREVASALVQIAATAILAIEALDLTDAMPNLDPVAAFAALFSEEEQEALDEPFDDTEISEPPFLVSLAHAGIATDSTFTLNEVAL